MSFSQRHGHKPKAADISIRNEAPADFRHAVLTLANLVGLQPARIRVLVCQVLLLQPDPNNWSPQNIEYENRELVESAPWYRVYDIAEALSADYRKRQMFSTDDIFDERLNEFFVEKGYGWKIENSEISIRGSETFEHAVSDTVALLESTNRPTASKEIQEALQDLSRRPQPDLTGAVHHAMNALECVARDIDGSADTLGKIIPRLNLPKPLDSGLEKFWGFASQKGRHILESQEPNFEDAELVVTLASAITTFLIRRSSSEASISK